MNWKEAILCTAVSIITQKTSFAYRPKPFSLRTRMNGKGPGDGIQPAFVFFMNF
jgi:hypothetical protein